MFISQTAPPNIAFPALQTSEALELEAFDTYAQMMSVYHTNLWLNAKLMVARSQANELEEKRIMDSLTQTMAATQLP